MLRYAGAISRSCPSADGQPETMKMGRTVDGCGAGVSPAVAGASCSRARAGCPPDSGRDARTTIFKAVKMGRQHPFLLRPTPQRIFSRLGL